MRLASTRSTFFSFDLLAELRQTNSALEQSVTQLHDELECVKDENARLRAQNKLHEVNAKRVREAVLLPPPMLCECENKKRLLTQSEIAAQFEADLYATPTKRFRQSSGEESELWLSE